MCPRLVFPFRSKSHFFISLYASRVLHLFFPTLVDISRRFPFPPRRREIHFFSRIDTRRELSNKFSPLRHLSLNILARFRTRKPRYIAAEKEEIPNLTVYSMPHILSSYRACFIKLSRTRTHGTKHHVREKALENACARVHVAEKPWRVLIMGAADNGLRNRRL